MKSASATGHRKRLRQRFLKNRLNGFHDYEVVELLLTYAISRRDVKPVAKAALGRFGSLRKLFGATREELASVEGIGENAALLLTLLKPLTAAYLCAPVKKRVMVNSSLDAVAVVNAAAGLEAESLSTIYLNTRNEVLYVDEVTRERGTGLPIKPRAVIEAAIEKNAKSVIFVNRAGGGKKASKGIVPEELAVVRSVEAAARALDITVYDYIVISNNRHTSAREEGYL